MKTDDPGAPCTDVGCGAIPMERMRWFTGRFMTARDLSDEQGYQLGRRWLHNRLFHGQGVVCGLDVRRHERPECQNRFVWVSAGIALDCCGRDLILERRMAVEWPLPPPEHKGGHEPTEQVVLCLRLAEQLVEWVPAVHDDGCCEPQRKEASRIRESVALEVRQLSALDPGCLSSVTSSEPCRDDCDEPLPRRDGCLDPMCPCGSCVPLALLTRHEGEPIAVDLSFRRELPPPPDYLTHISSINWTHGGELSLDELEERNGRLVVTFDRKLQPAEGDATGINRFTFRVEYGGLEENLEFLPADPEHPPMVDEDGFRAIFTIHPDVLRPRSRRDSSLAGYQVYVTMLGDFVLDCHGNPVDADHLRGRLPSGNGTSGGVFKSWFSVVPGSGEKEVEGP